jgi:hypothetical protein
MLHFVVSDPLGDSRGNPDHAGRGAKDDLGAGQRNGAKGAVLVAAANDLKGRDFPDLDL